MSRNLNEKRDKSCRCLKKELPGIRNSKHKCLEVRVAWKKQTKKLLSGAMRGREMPKVDSEVRGSQGPDFAVLQATLKT